MSEACQARPGCRARPAGARERGDDDDAERARAQHDVGGPGSPQRLVSRDPQEPLEPYSGRRQRRREKLGPDQGPETPGGRDRQQPRGEGATAGARRPLERHDRPPREPPAEDPVELGDPGSERCLLGQGERRRRRLPVAAFEGLTQGRKGQAMCRRMSGRLKMNSHGIVMIIEHMFDCQ